MSKLGCPQCGSFLLQAIQQQEWMEPVEFFFSENGDIEVEVSPAAEMGRDMATAVTTAYFCGECSNVWPGTEMFDALKNIREGARPTISKLAQDALESVAGKAEADSPYTFTTRSISITGRDMSQEVGHVRVHQEPPIDDNANMAKVLQAEVDKNMSKARAGARRLEERKRERDATMVKRDPMAGIKELFGNGP